MELNLDYCPTLRELYDTRKASGKSGRQFLSSGLSPKKNLLFIRGIMLEHKPAATLEIGLAWGGSALTFCATHRDLSRAPDHQHVAIDPMQNSLFDGAAELALSASGLKDYCDVFEQPSHYVLPKLLEQNRKFGLIYIDGSHRFDDVMLDYYYSFMLVHLGGIIMFDDSTQGPTQKVIRYIERNLSALIVRQPLEHFLPEGKERLRYKIANALRKNQLTAFKKIGDTHDPSWDNQRPLKQF
jgi:predicted O-methyltransferase YrrM